jgi:hypothetical protein
MARRSKIERLAVPLQVEIGRLRERYTLDQIVAHLRAMGGEAAEVSRSSLARYVRKVDEELAEDLRRSRHTAQFLAANLDDAPGSAALRLNAELLHDQIFRLLRQARAAIGEDGQEESMDAKALMSLSKALESIARAARTDQDYAAQAERRAEARAKGEAAEAAADAGRAAGLSADLVETIKARILGVTT